MSNTYIPGFTSSLQRSVPRYAGGGSVAGTSWTGQIDPAAILAQWAPSGTAAKELAGGPNAADFGAVSSYVQPGQYINFMGGQAAPNTNPYSGQQMYTYDVGGNYSPHKTLQYKGANTTDQNGNVVTSTFDVNPSQSVRLVNYDTGETLDFGTGLGAAQKAAAASQALAEKNNQGNWDVQLAPAGSQDWTSVAGNRKQANAVTEALTTAAQMGLIALPGVGQAIGKGLGLSGALATGVGTGLAAAAGRTGAGVLAGDNFLDSLKSGLTTGAISGLTAGALQALAPGVSEATKIANKTLAERGSAGLGGAVASVPGGIVVQGIKSALPAAISSAGGTVAGALAKGSQQIAQQASQQQQPNSFDPNAQIVVSAVKPPVTAPIFSAGPPVATGLGAAANGVIQQPNSFDPNAQIVVSAVKPPVTAPIFSAGPPVATALGAIANGVIQQPTPQPTAQQPVDQTADPADVIEVQGFLNRGFGIKELLAMGLPAAAITAAVAGSSGAAGGTAAGSQTGTQTGSTPSNGPTNLLQNTPYADKPGILQQIGNLSTLDKIRLAGLVGGTIGDLFSGGAKSTTTGIIPGGLGGVSSVFSAKLPAANLPAATPRIAQDIDYNRYGYGPEQSFFGNVPQGARNTSTAHTGYAEGGEVRDYDMVGALRAGIKPDEFGHMPDTYKLPNHMTFSEDSIYSTPEHAGGRWVQGGDGHWVFWPSQHNMRQHPMREMQNYFEQVEQNVPGRPDSYAVYPEDYRLPERKAGGGSAYAVGGPGDGREDKIPAMLSDGEYVMDAETVALLGNGSSKAGAKKLDDFRVNIRKQKGRKLASGKFSDGAKRPEQYLKGHK